MSELASYKIVQTGNIFELYQPEIPFKLKSNGKYDDQSEFDEPADRSEEYKQRRVHRSRNKIRRLVNSNFNSNSSFLTLTFDNAKVDELQQQDVLKSNQFFKKFIQRLNYETGRNNKYVSVIEFQRRGSVHYHMVSDIPFIPNDPKFNTTSKKTLNELWTGGNTKVNRINHVDNVGAYVSKYLTKEKVDDRFSGVPCYLRSRGLNEPTITYTNEPLSKLPLNAYQKVVYQNFYNTEYQGKIKYLQFNFNRDTIKLT